MIPRTLVLPFALALLAGCAQSKPPPPPPVAVSGKVVFAGGKPVTNMVVSLHAQDDQNAEGRRPTAVLDKDGRFRTEAIPGRYKVTLAPLPSQGGSPDGGASLVAPPNKNGPKEARGVPPGYKDAQSSPLQVTVPAAGGELDVLTVK